MDEGRWTMDDGRWTMDDGRWTMDDGRWTMDDGRWTMDDGRWTMDDRRWTAFYRPSSIVYRPLAAPAGSSATGALEAGAIADHGELAALRAAFALVSLEAGFGHLLAHGQVGPDNYRRLR